MKKSLRATLAVGYVGLSLADTIMAGSESAKVKRIRAVTKTLLMPTLAAATLTAPVRPPKALLAALGFSWGGDLALLSKAEPAFLAGAGSFGIAHGAYSTLWRAHQDRSEPMLAKTSTKALLATTLAAAPAIAYFAGRKDPALGGAVAAYSIALSGVAAQACALDPKIDATTRAMIATGALSFLASDTILGTNMFVLKEKSPLAERAVMATYTLAQGMLAAGAMRLPR